MRLTRSHTLLAVRPSASAASPPDWSRWVVKSAAVTSPEPLHLIGRCSVRTIQAPSPWTASISIVSAGRSGWRTEVTSTVDGPIARAASTAASVDSRSAGSVPVRNPSSNWFGVIRSALGTTRSRSSTGMSGWTKQPLLALPMTGSHA